MIQIKTAEQIALMRAAGPGRRPRRCERAARPPSRPGVTTAELDAIAETVIRDAGAVPSFMGYHGFPRPVDLRLGQRRDRARHPGPAQVLRDGDLISIDCGAILDGWHGDAGDHRRRSGEVDPSWPAS